MTCAALDSGRKVQRDKRLGPSPKTGRSLHGGRGAEAGKRPCSWNQAPDGKVKLAGRCNYAIRSVGLFDQNWIAARMLRSTVQSAIAGVVLSLAELLAGDQEAFALQDRETRLNRDVAVALAQAARRWIGNEARSALQGGVPNLSPGGTAPAANALPHTLSCAAASARVARLAPELNEAHRRKDSRLGVEFATN